MPARADDEKTLSRLSIITPTKNREMELGRLLRSVAGQSLPPSEIVVVDDSSGDATRRLVESMTPEFGNLSVALIYRRNPHGRGAAAARNAGLEFVTSPVVLFLDDDVVLDRHYIRCLL